MQATPGIVYRERLLAKLRDAGVDLSALWRMIQNDMRTGGGLSLLLHGACFRHPEELERDGYPDEMVRKAEEAADRQVEKSFAEIVELAQRLLPPAVQSAEPPPAEPPSETEPLSA